jgi:HlyD family secretion protein
MAESQVRNARLQFEDNQPTGTAARQAEMALRQARANLQAASATVEHATIKAPTAGALISRRVEQGDVVQPGKSLMVLSPAGETQLVVQIDEKNLSQLALGQKALSSADAYPQQAFPAELVYINPAIDPQRGSLEIKLHVPDPPAYLRQDMTVSVDIEVASKGAALVVPIVVLHDGAGKQPWVMKVQNGRTVRQPVRLGIRGTTRVEILDGLQAGDRVLGAGVDTNAEGRRVRTLVQSW